MPGLVRGLGLWSATAIVIGDTIGTGVFLVTSDMVRTVGSAALVFAAWIVGGLIVLFGAFCYAELGAAFPKAGGAYVYLERGLGPLWGFLFGWMSSFLERPVGMATLAAGFVRFIGFLLPAVAAPLWVGHVGGYSFSLTVAQPLAAAVIVVITAVNYLSVRLGGAIQILLTSLKIATIVLIVFLGVILGKHAAVTAGSVISPIRLGTLGAFLTALVPAMWAYNGFNDLGDLGEEIQQPHKNIPRAIIVGLLTVGGLYLAANLVYFHVLPLAQLAESQHVASDVVQSFAGHQGAAWLTLAMAISALGALHVVELTGARIPYAMARDGYFIRAFSTVHPAFRTPGVSILGLSAWSAVILLSGQYDQLFTCVIFASWILYGMTTASVIVLRRKRPDMERPYRTWGYPLVPVLFVLSAFSLVLSTLFDSPRESVFGLVLIIIGLPFYFYWKKRRA